MPIRCACPHCGTMLSAPDNRAGKYALCPGCKQKFTVPAPPEDQLEEVPDGPEAPAEPPRAPDRRPLLLLGLAAGLFALLLLGCAGAAGLYVLGSRAFADNDPGLAPQPGTSPRYPYPESRTVVRSLHEHYPDAVVTEWMGDRPEGDYARVTLHFRGTVPGEGYAVYTAVVNVHPDRVLIKRVWMSGEAN